MSRSTRSLGDQRSARPWRALPVVLLALSGGLSAAAQTPAPTAPAGAPPAPAGAAKPAASEATIADVAGEARKALAEIESLGRIADSDVALRKISEALPSLETRVAAGAEDVERMIRAATTLSRLAEIQRRWQLEKRDLESWNETVTARAVEVERRLARLAAIRSQWQTAAEDARAAGAPAPVIARIREVITAAGDTRARIEERSRQLLVKQSRIADLLDRVDAIGRQVADAREQLRGQLFGATAPPLWSSLRGVSDEGVETTLADVLRSLREEQEPVVGFLVRRRDPLVAHGLLFLVLVGGAFALRPRARKLRETEADFAPSAGFFEHPVMTAWVASLLLFGWLHPESPQAARGAVGMLLLLPLVLLFRPVLAPAARPVLLALAVFYLVDRARDIIEAAPLAERIVFTGEIAAAALLTLAFVRRGRFSGLARDPRWRVAIDRVARGAAAVLAIALLASIGGWLTLARILGQGVLSTGYMAFGLYAILQLLYGLLAVAIHSSAARRLRIVRRRGARIMDGAFRLARVAAVLAFVYGALQRFNLDEIVVGVLGSVLTTEVSIGELSLSLGSVLSFVAAVVVAIYASRITQFVLDEEVTPRFSLPRGVPYAISATGRYTVLLMGFFAAVSAAGVDLTRFSLLAGALGVGIGFGLQNVVNNFVSGLILLFERPVQRGDKVSIGTTLGEVVRIGIRSSTIRSLEGAEVIVPNASLISDVVINWTLSDRRRRMQLDVGVAYGTDPARVIELLTQVAVAQSGVLQDPAPAAYFVGFGDSSLDFRVLAWAASFEDFLQVQSDLSVSVNRALAEAGITIPFPQRDVHVIDVPQRSADPRP